MFQMKHMLSAVGALLLAAPPIHALSGVVYTWSKHPEGGSQYEYDSLNWITRVYARVDNEDKPRLLFDTEWSGWSLTFPPTPLQFSVGRVYAIAVRKADIREAQGRKGLHSLRETIARLGLMQLVELPRVSSGTVRVIGRIDSQLPPRSISISPDGGKVLYVGYGPSNVSGAEGTHFRAAHLVIQSTTDGAILSSSPLSGFIGNAAVERIGWLPDSRRVFVHSDVSSVKISFSSEAIANAGIHIIDPMSKNSAKIAQKLLEPPRWDSTRGFSGDVKFLGILGSGDYLLMQLNYLGRTGSPQPSFYRVNPRVGDYRLLDMAGTSYSGCVLKIGSNEKFGCPLRGVPNAFMETDFTTGRTRRLDFDPNERPAWPMAIVNFVGWGDFQASGSPTMAPTLTGQE